MIYFDNNATTPILPEVFEAMRPFLQDAFGNPSSAHELGNKARVAVDKARKQVADALGVMTSELIFTGCGSEANNQAIVGTLLHHFPSSGKNLVISAIEHPAVLETARWAAEKFGFELRIPPIQLSENSVALAPITELIDEHTVLVSFMMANNETGLLLPVEQIFAHARQMGAMCHCDAVQGLGKGKVRPKSLGADLMSFSAHKFHGPKGIGGLFVRRGVRLEPLIHGGPQESGRRAGTEGVANIVAMGRAAELADQIDPAEIASVRDYFEQRLIECYGNRVVINFCDFPRTPNASSVRFTKQDGNLLLIKLDRKGICCSTGAACSSGSLSPSKGLMAMGLSEKEAASTLRFSFSRLNTTEEVDRCIEALTRVFRP